METDATNNIVYYLSVDKAHATSIAGIRHWPNLKAAFDEDNLWIKDLDYAQVNSVEVKSIPYINIFYADGTKLNLLNSRLPHRNIPNVLWTALNRLLPITLPALNHNYFGVNQAINISIVPSTIEAEPVAMITSVTALQDYIVTAAAVRLKNIEWVILNNDKVILKGLPLLPVIGDVYWSRNYFLLPAGYDLELFLLDEEINKLINANNESYVVWNKNGSYFLVDKKIFRPLSLSSFNLSNQNI